MSFGKALRDFRKHELNIRSNEAAARLGIQATTYANYEAGSRAVPIDLLPTIKEKFGISDERFLQMLLGEQVCKQKTANQLLQEIETLHERYKQLFAEEHYELLTTTPELRELIMLLAKLDQKKRTATLSAVRQLISVQADLMRKIEKLEWQVEDMHAQLSELEE